VISLFSRPLASPVRFPYNPSLALSAALSSGGFAPTFYFAPGLFESPEERAERVGQGSIEERVHQLAERVAMDNGLELVHAEVAGPEGKPILRIYIDKPEGVTHEDCAAMSLHLGTILDVEDFIHSAYTLEVSSPGLERGLYKTSDYARFAGRIAKVKSRVAINGQRNFRGRILGLEGSQVIFEDKTSGRVTIPFEAIVKANLELDVEEEFRRARERELAAEAARKVDGHD
jgi:ribosome maturation factor RimP